ncbi:hypothetical protein BMG03_19100 (plasmid) [Thioclava nitratireducens]|uniref:AtuA-like ferredoxin-fold domain-containing protein n=1 Tax=Thioclava nitratireducens TaxID=1915078 RepID=A0ABM6IM42_9RHOB|nr:hypothetical protein [Thioclava nitratireducens]AQS50035.1 hypothetical protein BMG03_19100 [Thioclava nitratireducens]
MKLHDLAHGRTGDKGDTSNISVIAYRPEDFPRLEAQVTSERVAAHLGQPSEAVTRYVLPKLCAMNFVIRGALAGGVTRSLALDAHGKCLSSVLLEMPLNPRGAG